jgi:hypothetical protein
MPFTAYSTTRSGRVAINFSCVTDFSPPGYCECRQYFFSRMSPVIFILYFEKRNTATLEVLWTVPGGQRVAVAGDAIVHLKR